MTKSLNIAILGASGYTGAELIRILLSHPHAKIAALTGDASAGKSIGEVYPHLAHTGLPPLKTIEKTDFSTMDVVFCCLPHGTTQAVIAALLSLPHRGRGGVGASTAKSQISSKNAPLPASPLRGEGKIIDLSADFRLKSAAEYAKWYGHPHQAVELQKEAVYGLTEHARDKVRKARLVANPGCYPTSALLPLVPLIKEGAIDRKGIIINSASGVTGAGRSARQSSLFTEVNDGMSVYGVASHRHTPEIEQGLGGVSVTFTPHLAPMNRGILSTIYVKGDARAVRAAWEKTYEGEPFVQVLAKGIMPSTHQVRGANHCVMNVFESRVKGEAIIVSAIDNLVKGASGQAVQNMNAMFGFPETDGLQMTAMFP